MSFLGSPSNSAEESPTGPQHSHGSEGMTSSSAVSSVMSDDTPDQPDDSVEPQDASGDDGDSACDVNPPPVKGILLSQIKKGDHVGFNNEVFHVIEVEAHEKARKLVFRNSVNDRLRDIWTTKNSNVDLDFYSDRLFWPPVHERAATHFRVLSVRGTVVSIRDIRLPHGAPMHKRIPKQTVGRVFRGDWSFWPNQTGHYPIEYVSLKSDRICAMYSAEYDKEEMPRKEGVSREEDPREEEVPIEEEDLRKEEDLREEEDPIEEEDPEVAEQQDVDRSSKLPQHDVTASHPGKTPELIQFETTILGIEKGLQDMADARRAFEDA